MANACFYLFRSFHFFAYSWCLYLTFSFWVQFLSSLSRYFINLSRKEVNLSQNVFISSSLLNDNVTSSVKLLSWLSVFNVDVTEKKASNIIDAHFYNNVFLLRTQFHHKVHYTSAC